LMEGFQSDSGSRADEGRRLVLTIAFVLVIVHLAGLLLVAFFAASFFFQTPGAAEALVQTTAFERNPDDSTMSALRSVFVDEALPREDQAQFDPMVEPEESINAPATEAVESAFLTMLTTLAPYQPEGVFFNPAGCRVPQDGEPVEGNGWTLSRRTYDMLGHAAELFGAVLDPGSLTIVYTNVENNGIIRLPVVEENGALQIGMISGNGFDTRYGEVEPLIRALRVSGFAAWFWDWDEQYLGSEPVIEAIPIGDDALPEELHQLVRGSAGYFDGYRIWLDGQRGMDPHGGPIVCQWMVDDGLVDVDQAANLPRVGTPLGEWQRQLQEIAASFITDTRKETNRLAREIGFLGGTVEDPSNMCGPLTAAILGETGLLPSEVGPIRDPKSFWLANPAVNGRPWSLFPLDDYALYNVETALSQFSFSDWPLCPGDILFTYAGVGEYSHVFVVTEIDPQGRAYTVTNQIQSDGSFLVERVLLYDPNNPAAGAFRNEWTTNVERGRTGLGGFDVLRRISSCLQEGTSVTYVVQPGDTLPAIAATFRSGVDEILRASGLPADTTVLDVGETLTLPVNLAGANP